MAMKDTLAISDDKGAATKRWLPCPVAAWITVAVHIIVIQGAGRPVSFPFFVWHGPIIICLTCL